MRRCEEALTASVDVGNCIRYFATADEIGAEGLRDHCSKLISRLCVRGDASGCERCGGMGGEEPDPPEESLF